MINNNISFGKKIPIAICNVQNKKTGMFEPATLYEYDCNDIQDVIELKNSHKKWFFIGIIIQNMISKLNIIKSIKKNPFKTNFELKNDLLYKNDFKQRFFSLQTDKEEIIGICQANNSNKSLNIEFIESQFSSHKYVGSSMLAILGIKTLKEGNKYISICTSTNEAKDFYKKCGFKKSFLYSFKLNKKNIKNLINYVEDNTKSPIIDLRN